MNAPRAINPSDQNKQKARKQLRLSAEIWPIVCLALIAVLMTAGLSVIHQVTTPIIAARAEEAAVAEKKAMLPEAVRFEAVDETTWQELLQTQDPNLSVSSAEKAYDQQGQLIGFSFNAAPAGYAAPVELLIVIRADQSVAGFRVMQHQETAGLGAKAGEPAFRDQFVGLGKGGQQLTVYPAAQAAAAAQDPGGIDAITSATITSRAVTRAVNEAIQLTGLLLKEVQHG